MLADPKRKRSYGPTGSRNKNWYKGTDHFGAKMLSQMGWTEGKGLGAKEQGSSDFIQIDLKKDTVGVGFDASSLNKIGQHMDTFNSILSNLSVVKCSAVDDKDGSEKIEAASESLEPVKFKDFKEVKRVKLCKRRLDNKTLANKTRKDIDVVLGLEPKRDSKSNEDEVVRKRRKIDGEDDETPNQLVTSSVSVQDYFSEKLKKRNEKRTQLKTQSTDDCSNAIDRTSDEEERTSFKC